MDKGQEQFLSTAIKVLMRMLQLDTLQQGMRSGKWKTSKQFRDKTSERRTRCGTELHSRKDTGFVRI